MGILPPVETDMLHAIKYPSPQTSTDFGHWDYFALKSFHEWHSVTDLIAAFQIRHTKNDCSICQAIIPILETSVLPLE